MVFDVVIVGGGPAGLKACSTLIKAGIDNVCLLEKKNDVGGRCRTVVESADFAHSLPTAQHDSGALRFTNKHALVKSELERLGLESEAMSGPDTFTTGRGSHAYLSLYEDDLPNGLNTTLKPASENDVAIFEAWRQLGAGGARHLTDRDGYDAIHDLSLPEWMNDNSKTHEEQYFIVKQGYQAIFERMRSEMESHIKVNKFVTKIEKKATTWHVSCMDDDVFAAKRLILAAPPHALFRVEGLGATLKSRLIMHSVQTFPLLRVFGRWKQPHGIRGHSFHPGPVRQVQEISPTLAMINYCGGQTAKTWNTKQLIDRKGAEQFLMQRVKAIYPTLTDPQHIWWHYWHHAVHFWRLCANRKHMSSCLQQPLGQDETTVFMCGEAISEKWHAWVEGALETAITAANLVVNHQTIQYPLRQFQSIDGSHLLSVGGAVIDPRLHDWMKYHPGGKEVLKKYAGKDATSLFLSHTPLHPDYALSMLFRNMVGFIRN